MPLIKGFRATSISHAFLLNSLVATITVMVAVLAKDQLQSTYKDKDGVDHTLQRQFTWKDVALTAVVTFTTTMFSFWIMYLLFGFGCGQLCTD